MTLAAWVQALPTVNACLNGLAAVFLLVGFLLIKKEKIEAHRWAMVAACVISGLFLVSYLIYHYQIGGGKKFTGQGWIRWVYFPLLISHIILAASLVLFVPLTLYRAAREQFKKHRAIAKITWPVWMYVSVTGVIIYVMLYLVYP